MVFHRLLPGMVLLALAAPSRGEIGVQEDAERVVLRSETSTLALSKAAHSAAVSLKDRATGQEFMAPGQEAALFQLTFTRAGEQSGDTVTLGAREARHLAVELKRENGREAAVLHYDGFADWPSLAVECRATVYRLRFTMKSELSGGAGSVSLAAMSHTDWQL